MKTVGDPRNTHGEVFCTKKVQHWCAAQLGWEIRHLVLNGMKLKNRSGQGSKGLTLGLFVYLIY
jgi:hypothetical protein